MPDKLTVRFRVGQVLKNRRILLYLDDEIVVKRKRPIMAPGEMEQVVLTRDMLASHPDLHSVRIVTEEA